MKKLITLFTILVISTTIFAQIPNPSFESWSGGLPVQWRNDGPADAFSQSSDAHAGNYALKLFVDASTGGGHLTGIGADTAAPAYFNFWYKLKSVNGDMLTFSSSLFCTSGNNAFMVYFIDTSTSVYKLYSASYIYYHTCSEDTITVTFNLTTSNQAYAGLDTSTYSIIDDLFFSKTSGIDAINKNAAVLEPCAPNPATTVADIIYSIPVPATVNVDLYDITGRKIEALLNNTEQSPGRYKIQTDVSQLSSGVYFYTLTVNGQTYTQKLAVTHQ